MSYLDFLNSAKQRNPSATGSTSSIDRIFFVVGPTGPTGIYAFYGATAPGITANGVLWYNTDDGRLYTSVFGVFAQV